jgi:hypothetical protein
MAENRLAGQRYKVPAPVDAAAAYDEPAYQVPTIRRHLPKFLDEVTDDLAAFMGKELDRAGVPRKGRAG